MTTSALDFPGKAAMLATLEQDAEYALEFILRLHEPQHCRTFIEDRLAGKDLTFYVDTVYAAEKEREGDLESLYAWQDKYLIGQPV